LMLLVRVLIQMLYTSGVERRRAPLHPMHDITLVEQQLRQIGAVLAGDSGDQGDLGLGRTGHAGLVSWLDAGGTALVAAAAAASPQRRASAKRSISSSLERERASWSLWTRALETSGTAAARRIAA